MNPGELNRRITYAKLVQTENAFQDFTYVWVDQLTTWANVKPSRRQFATGRQLEAGEQVITDGTIFTTRYRRDFTPTKDMRILYKSRYYTIHSILDIQDDHRFYEILTRVTDENTPESEAT